MSNTLFRVGEIEAQPVVVDGAMLAVLWDRMSQFPILFSTTKETSFPAFRSIIEDPDTLLILFKKEGLQEPLGLGMVYDETPGIEAQLQVSFFDRQLKEREPITREFVKWVIEERKVRRVGVHVRADAKNFRDFLERVGFYLEGIKKNWVEREERLYDLHLYGITQTECDQLWMKGHSWAKPRVRPLKVYEVR